MPTDLSGLFKLKSNILLQINNQSHRCLDERFIFKKQGPDRLPVFLFLAKKYHFTKKSAISNFYMSALFKAKFCWQFLMSYRYSIYYWLETKDKQTAGYVRVDGKYYFINEEE